MAYSGVVRDVRRAVALEKPRRMPVFACSEEFDERETERIMSIGRLEGGYLFNTGEMNPRDVPYQNMKAMVRAARRAGI